MRSVPSPKLGKRQRPRPRGAFTLIETMMTLVIVTVAITATCELLTAGTDANISGNELTTGVNLANTVHEMAIGLPLSRSSETVIGPWHDVWDLNGKIFSPPIDAARRPIATQSNWEQRVRVQSVDEKNITQVIPDDRNAPTARLTVEIYHEGHFVYTASWLIASAETSPSAIR